MIDNLDPVIKLAFECGDLTQQTVEMVSRFASTWAVSGYDALLECRVVTEARIVEIISTKGGIERCNLDSDQFNISLDALMKIPFAVARQFRSIPLAFNGSENILTCVIANPLDAEAVKALAAIAKCELKPLIAERTKIDFMLGEAYPIELQIPLPNRGDSKNAITSG